MTPIEVVAAISGILCVWLTIKQNVWSWPIGLVQVALYIYIFIGVKLYSDAILQVFFIVTSLYGWYQWLHGGENKTRIKVSLLKDSMLILIFGLTLIATAIWGYMMHRFLGAAAPYADAFILVASVVATYLMAKKKLECWWFWVVVDIAAICVYFYKQLYITSGLYVVFFVLAIRGLKEWSKSYVKSAIDTINSNRL